MYTDRLLTHNDHSIMQSCNGFVIVQPNKLQRMPNEASAKKKRIILSAHRKNKQTLSSHSKEPAESKISQGKVMREDKMDQSMAFNCASINNSLEIFDEDPGYRHFQFYQNEQDRSEPLESKGNSRAQQLQTVPSTAHMHKKNIKQDQSSCQQASKIATTISLTSFHVPSQHCSKKIMTCPSRRFIDLTIKRDYKQLSHQSSDSLLLSVDKTCLNRSNIFQTGRSILSSVSVNSVQFAVGRTPSQRKKALTITCHKYEGENTKKARNESLSKCNSIKLFGKFN